MDDFNFVIEAHDLTKDFDGKLAVNHIDLNVKKGELYAFLGPNGSGKSTTIKMLMDLLQPTYGSVSMFNKSLQGNALEIKRRIAYIPDTPNTLGKLTGDEYLDFYASIFQMDKTQYGTKKNELLSLFELVGKTNQQIENYSHGMRQKIVLVANLMHEPEIIFLDEPTVGLDPLSTRNLKNYLRHQVSLGKTVFLTTHILEIAEQLADRIGIIYEGNLKVEGTLQQLYALYPEHSRSLEDIFLAVTGKHEVSYD
ncbi:ABC transporter ATP-binding protein [Macrococcus psychrotolerans]|uniref:ABC transporter ATP-binding protein n=1 Tax=Macrococcus psychrotolerans TaxID=3039389 RepID=A0AAU6RLW1_9STAP